MTDSKLFMSDAAIDDVIAGMARMLQRRLADQQITNPVMIGIHTGGVWVAERLHQALGISEPLGTLDISFYRDDFTRIGMNPQVRPSQIPFDVDDRHIILVDDVLQSGRTIRAALNEIFDFGRPASVTLAVLIQRSGRELPIQPDVFGLEPPLEASEHIRLRGPEPLHLEISAKALPRHAEEEE
jgi:pyrimidine operon attenuation protein/uracil phosphoribosyltransferase